VALVAGTDASDLRLWVQPKTLLGAAWLQLARAIDSGAVPFRCQYQGCGRPFVPRRNDATFCSDRCRQANHRRKSK
jgi:hypothetical protein